MIRLKALLDTAEFVPLLKQGLPEAITATVAEGKGQIAIDLQPDSLFLRYLGRDEKRADRYAIFSGQVLTNTEAFVLRQALSKSKEAMRTKVNDANLSAGMRDAALAAVEGLELTEEITKGDGVVSLASAALPGVTRSKVWKRLNHQTLKTDAAVIAEVVRMIIKE
jgi:hypothetical protein